MRLNLKANGPANRQSDPSRLNPLVADSTTTSSVFRPSRMPLIKPRGVDGTEGLSSLFVWGAARSLKHRQTCYLMKHSYSANVREAELFVCIPFLRRTRRAPHPRLRRRTPPRRIDEVTGFMQCGGGGSRGDRADCHLPLRLFMTLFLPFNQPQTWERGVVR